MDCEDEVVMRVPVYLQDTRSLDIQLLQYPLRPLYRPYGDQGELVAVQYREKQNTFLFSYTKTYEDDVQTDDGGFAEKLHYLSSTNLAKKPSGAMFGHGKGVQKHGNDYSMNLLLIRRGAAYIVKNIDTQQFRTMYQKELPNPEKQELRIPERKQIDHYQLRMLQLQEPWIPVMNIFKHGSLESSNILHKISKQSESRLVFNTDVMTYLHNLTDKGINIEGVEVITKVVSMKDLEGLSKEEAVIKLLSILECASFSTLKDNFPFTIDDSELLELLYPHCVTISGNFVVKSNIAVESLHDLNVYAGKNEGAIAALDDYFGECRNLILLIYINGKTVVPAAVSNVPGFALKSPKLRDVFSKIMRPLSKISSDRASSEFALPVDSKMAALESVREHTTKCQGELKGCVKLLSLKLKKLTEILKG